MDTSLELGRIHSSILTSRLVVFYSLTKPARKFSHVYVNNYKSFSKFLINAESLRIMNKIYKWTLRYQYISDYLIVFYTTLF